MDNAPLLELKGINIGYETPTGTVFAANDINLSLYPRDALGIVGESGSGKSTLAMGVLSLLPSNARMSGEALFAGTNLVGLSDAELKSFRWKKISVVFQRAMNSLSPVYTIGEQVHDIYKVHMPNATRKEADEVITAFLNVVNLTDRVLSLYQHQLSGGMLQRICIALSLIFHPQIVIFDEATTALDVVTQGQVIGEIKRLQKNMNVSSIVITHDISVVAELCNRIAVMYAGYIVESGLTEEVLTRPVHPYTDGLVASFPSVETSKTMVRGIPGTLPNLKEKPQGCVFAPRCRLVQDICRLQQPVTEEITPGHFVTCHAHLGRNSATPSDTDDLGDDGGSEGGLNV